ncbi:MAG: hypothetical protein JXJ04_08695 [Spirochaetales bacterium]|nr:hypothetical protein [Spirochaetales bacterium]
MENQHKSRIFIFYHIIEILFSLGVLTWYILPYYITGLFKILPFNFPYLLFVNGQELYILVLSGILTYLIPVICCLKLIAVFFRKKLSFLCAAEEFLPIVLNIIVSGCVVVLIALYIQTYAINLEFFFSLSLYTYILGFISLVYNIFYSVSLVRFFRKVNPHYQDYLVFQKTYKQDKENGLKIGIIGIQ